MADLDWWIVDRYLAGEATPAERAIVERWIARSPKFQRLVAELHRDSLDAQAIGHAAADVQARLERDMAAIPAVAFRRRIPYQPPRLFIQSARPFRTGWLRAAAAVALLVGGSLVVWQTSHSVAHPTDAALRTVTAPVKRRVTVALPDGSEVLLSPGSTVRYALTLATDARRQVQLEGEAYFDVRHDARRPFVVSAGNLIAEDLGTQFVVRAYPEDSYGRVVVREGLVGIGQVVVGPGELGRISPNGHPVVEQADTMSWFAWTRGRLAFAGMPLREALPKLSRWYDLEFRLADPALGDVELVGTLPEQTGDGAVEAIGLAFGLDVERQGRVVTFR